MNKKKKITKKEETISRGIANLFFNTLGAIKSYSGVTPEGSTIILMNRRRFGRIVEETIKMEQDYIATLQSASFKQAMEITENLRSTALNGELTESEKETQAAQQLIVDETENTLKTFQNNLYSKEVPMPKIEFISRKDFVNLVAANLIDEPKEGEEKQAGLYSGSLEILSELLIKTEL